VIRKYLELVKFAHTLFALPFALMAMLVAGRGLPGWWTSFWILMAMVSARSMAMTFNRLLDIRYDQQNPRTWNRPLITGAVTVKQAWLFWGIWSVLFFLSASQLNPLCLGLAPLVWLVLNGYSYGKRFTNWTHLWLGLSLGLAPLGAWVAVTGKVAWAPVPLGLGVLFWVAGFDVIYSLQDEAVDRKLGLHSLVIRLGPVNALILSRIFHLVSLMFFIVFGIGSELGSFFFSGVGIVALTLLYEQSLVSAEDRSRINTAFFTANGFISLLLLLATGLDLLLA
jgi:4-hydroxybenzoate polyprenyltransferase